MSAASQGLTQGQGNGTKRKEEGFAAVFATSLDISKAKQIACFPYWHIDLNAGCGVNLKAGCEGSPLVFLREAVQAGRSIRAYFCDINSESVRELRRRVRDLACPLPEGFHVEVKESDNATFLEYVAGEIRKRERNTQYTVGTVLCDPNGFREGFPREALSGFATSFPRIDVVLNLNASLFARVRGCKRDGQAAFQNWPEFTDLTKQFPRAYWMVRAPGEAGRFGGERFITLVGRNIETGRRRFKEFYPLESAAGQHIVTKLTRPPEEQLRLF